MLPSRYHLIFSKESFTFVSSTHPLLSGFYLQKLHRLGSPVTSLCSLFFFSFCSKKYLCIYLWLGWVLVSAHRLSLIVESRGLLFVAVYGLLIVVASLVAEHRLSSRDLRVYLLQGMWDLPGPGIEPVSLALQGGLSTTVPPRKLHSVVKPHGPVRVFFFSLIKLLAEFDAIDSSVFTESFSLVSMTPFFLISFLSQVPPAQPAWVFHGCCSK